MLHLSVTTRGSSTMHHWATIASGGRVNLSDRALERDAESAQRIRIKSNPRTSQSEVVPLPCLIVVNTESTLQLPASKESMHVTIGEVRIGALEDVAVWLIVTPKRPLRRRTPSLLAVR